jgi:hypothetical protein
MKDEQGCERMNEMRRWTMLELGEDGGCSDEPESGGEHF